MFKDRGSYCFWIMHIKRVLRKIFDDRMTFPGWSSVASETLKQCFHIPYESFFRSTSPVKIYNLVRARLSDARQYDKQINRAAG